MVKSILTESPNYNWKNLLWYREKNHFTSYFKKNKHIYKFFEFWKQNCFLNLFTSIKNKNENFKICTLDVKKRNWNKYISNITIGVCQLCLEWHWYKTSAWRLLLFRGQREREKELERERGRMRKKRKGKERKKQSVCDRRFMWLPFAIRSKTLDMFHLPIPQNRGK